MTRKVLTNYAKLRISDQFTFSKSVVNAMTGNVNFPNPSPAPAAFNIIIDDYGSAIEAAKTKDVNAVARRNALQAKVVSALSAYGEYVNLMAKGDVEKLRSSGMDLNKERTPTVLTKPIISVGQSTQPGSVQVRVTAGKGAEVYTYQYTESIDGDGVWHSITGATKSMQITGLTEGKQYWFRVVAVGSFNRQYQSDAVPAYVAQHVGIKAA